MTTSCGRVDTTVLDRFGARISRGPELYSLEAKANSALPRPSAASLTSHPSFGALPLTNAATSWVTSQCSVALRAVPVSAASVGVATNAPPGVHGVVPLQVFHVAPL
jgi:hypothetical protein